MNLSPTQIKTYLQCPAKYFFRFVAKVRKPISREMLFGRAIDSALSCHYDALIRRHEPPPEDIVTGVFEQQLHDIAQTETEISPKTLGPDIDVGVKALRSYRRDISPRTSPVAVQSPVVYNVGEVEITGYADLVETKGVTDWKTASRRLSTIRADDLLQLVCYQYGLGVEFPSSTRLSIHAIVRAEEPEVYVLSKHFEAEDLQLFLSTLEQVARGVRAQVFPPNRAHPYCRRKYCPYWAECQQQYGGHVPEGPQE